MRVCESFKHVVQFVLGFAHPENIHPVEKHPPLKYGVRMRVKSISPVKEYRIIYREVSLPTE